MSSDKQYHQIWRQRQRDIAAGRVEKPVKLKPTGAEHAKAYRDRQRAKMGKSVVVHQDRSDEAIEAAIIARGRVLAAMMQTPVCMWPEAWLED